MQVLEKEQVEQFIIHEVKCNRCGETVFSLDANPFNANLSEYLSIKKKWGYFSKIFGDETIHELDICERCYADFLSTCKIAPKGFGENYYYSEEYPIDERKVFEEWKSKYKRSDGE